MHVGSSSVNSPLLNCARTLLRTSPGMTRGDSFSFSVGVIVSVFPLHEVTLTRGLELALELELGSELELRDCSSMVG